MEKQIINENCVRFIYSGVIAINCIRETYRGRDGIIREYWEARLYNNGKKFFNKELDFYVYSYVGETAEEARDEIIKGIKEQHNISLGRANECLEVLHLIGETPNPPEDQD